jgi:hypothetical protein
MIDIAIAGSANMNIDVEMLVEFSGAGRRCHGKCGDDGKGEGCEGFAVHLDAPDLSVDLDFVAVFRFRQLIS